MNFDCGIYSITSPSGRQYIGQAQSFKIRWQKHITSLRKGNHRCKPLQKAWDKYGEDSFIFSKIAIIPIDQLSIREQEQFDAFVSSGKREKLYNVSLCAKAPMRGITGVDHPGSLPVLCITNGMTFINGLDAVQWLRQNGYPKADNSTISAAISGRLRTAYGLRWGRIGDESKPEDAPTIRSIPRGSNHYAAKSVVCIQTGMQFDTVSKAAAWLREHGFPKASHRLISSVCLGNEKTGYGYQWKYSGDPDPSPVQGRPRGLNNHKSRSVVCLETGEKFDLMSDAVKWLKANGSVKAGLPSISLACAGKLKSAYGYRWQYA
jgi:hypothetical protein